MYEFIYEAFDFLNKFQDTTNNIAQTIFVIEKEDRLDFYYTERGIMFSSNITYDNIFELMYNSYGVQTMEEAIQRFKERFLIRTTNPVDVIKDNDDMENIEDSKKPIRLEIAVLAAKLKKFDFEFKGSVMDMPFGGYETFDDCVKAQMKKGYNKKQAGGICGLIEKRHKEKMSKK